MHSTINSNLCIFAFQILFENMKFRFLIFLVSFFIVNCALFAQEENSQRPKIGLVLSGGGAKGFAHIGILKALEKEGIKPDYITGTSMGSIVGGLYAIGYSADQLDSLVRNIDWDKVLSNNIPLNYISYEEKEYYSRYLLELFIENGGLKLPSGLIEGQILSETLSHYTWPSTKYETFDDFPIPFRCISTDVSTGKEIIFSDGPLSEAMRASMAIPTVFTSAELDGTLAVDGGILNNFPVEEAIKLGADIIIGVNVSGGFESAEEIGNMVGILLQISMIPSLERMEKQIELCDIYIEPDLKENTTGSFSNYEEILELGDLAGENVREQFRAIKGIKSVPKRKDELVSMKVSPVILDEIELVGLKSKSEVLVMSKFGYEVGDTVSRKNVEQGVRRIYGINNFKKVIYHIDHIDSERVKLKIKIYEKPEKSLRVGLHYDNVFSAGITANVTLRNTLGNNTRSIIAGDISENPRFRFDYLKYIGAKRRHALNVRYDYRSLQVPSYVNGELEDLEVNKNHIASIGLMSTQSLKEFTFINARYEFEGLKYKVGNVAPEGIKALRLNRFHLLAGYVRNTHNDRNYPSSGANLDLVISLFPMNDYNLKYNSGVDTIYIPIDSIDFDLPVTKTELDAVVNELTPDFFATIQFHYSRLIPLAKNFQLHPLISVGATFSTEDQNSIFNNFIVGGLQRVDFDDITFLGLNYREITAPNVGVLGVQFQNILFKNFFLRYGVNGLLFHEHVPLNQLEKFDFPDMVENNSIIGYGINIRYKSLIGPITFGLSYNNRDPNPRYYFAVGFSFNYSD